LRKTFCSSEAIKTWDLDAAKDEGSTQSNLVLLAPILHTWE